MNLIPDQPVNCPTCGVKFEGPFCYACGEKQTSPKDYTLKKYSAQALDMFTHFDGKFFNSFKYLLFYPGKLTEENLQGRKVKLMKPLQLYVVVNLIYYFLLKKADIFLIYLSQLYKDNTMGIQSTVQHYAGKANLSVDDYILKFDNLLPTTSKAMLALLIPLLALVFWLLYVRKAKNFVPHLIHTTHFFSFFLVFTLLFVWIIIIPLQNTRLLNDYRIWIWGLNVPILGMYLYFSLKRVYKQSVRITLLKTLIVLSWVIVIQNVYRTGIVWVNFLFV